MNRLTKLTLAGLALASAIGAHAGIVVDGTKDSAYGSALSLQTIVTGFGTAANSGSELDGGYAVIQGGTLYLMLTGDLQQNNNHLDIYFGTNAAGQSSITGTGTGMDGTTLPTGFHASQIFDINGDATDLYVNQLSYVSSAWTNNYLGEVTGAWGLGNNTLTGGTNPNGVLVAANNSNVDTQTGGAGTALTAGYAAGVTTGVELGISLAALGSPTGNITVLAAINGGGDGYLSNQFLGGANVGTGNLGSNQNIGASGVTPFTITQQSVPEPSSIFALVTGGIALVSRRRRKA